MKPKITPTANEIFLKDNEFIVSKTDLKGRITYANRTFMRIASYAEEQLLGIQHNIVRHPDIPRGVFKFLWDALKSNQEFFGYVKNMTANGDFYWVFANITPDTTPEGKIVGYYSVRTKPKQSAIDIISPIYKEMLALEQQVGPARACDASIGLLVDKLNSLNTTYEKFVLSL
ncbi:MAG: PAS domain-containing protein [Pseudomonadota bacterium]